MNNEIREILLGVLKEQDIFENEILSGHCTFKIGGAADYLVVPPGMNELVGVIERLKEAGVRYFVLGNGSNVLFDDAGFRGVVIKTSGVAEYRVDDDKITADAGMTLARLAGVAMEASLTGLEFAAGIPGTLGAAVRINAGAYGGEMSDCVVSTRYMDETGALRGLSEPGVIQLDDSEDHAFGYRKSRFSDKKWIVLQSTLQLSFGDKDEIKKKMRDFAERRMSKQPLDLPSAGSAFKRPEGYFAGKLIEDCGLRGYAVGGAQISEKHCGFIVNRGGASADDVHKLVEHVQDRVREQFGVELEREIEYVKAE